MTDTAISTDTAAASTDAAPGPLLQKDALEAVEQRVNPANMLVLMVILPLPASNQAETPAPDAQGDNSAQPKQPAEAKGAATEADPGAATTSPEAKKKWANPLENQIVASVTNLGDAALNIADAFSKTSMPSAPAFSLLSQFSGQGAFTTFQGSKDGPKNFTEAREQAEAEKAKKDAAAEAGAASAAAAPSASAIDSAFAARGKAAIAAEKAKAEAAAAAPATPSDPTPTETALARAKAQETDADAEKAKTEASADAKGATETEAAVATEASAPAGTTANAASSPKKKSFQWPNLAQHQILNAIANFGDAAVNAADIFTKTSLPAAPALNLLSQFSGQGAFTTFQGSKEGPKNLAEAREMAEKAQAEKEAKAAAKKETEAAEAKAKEAAAEQFLKMVEQRLETIVSLLNPTGDTKGHMHPLADELARLVRETALNEHERRGWY
jgi:chemotaxis protein histidine kinase CheA